MKQKELFKTYDRQSLIGSYRHSDNRMHHDRYSGRPAPTDFIVRLDEDEQIELIRPELPEAVRVTVIQAVALVLGKSVKVPCEVIRGNISVRVSYLIKL